MRTPLLLSEEYRMLSKKQLKTMFLKVLYEIQYGKLKGYSNGIDSIVPQWMNQYYSTKLTQEECQLTHEVIQELKASGLIVQDASQSSSMFQVLTPRGKEIVERQKDPDIYGLQLEQVIKNAGLLSRCLDIFNNDDYEIAIFTAYKMIEEEVRKKAGLDASFYGDTLITEALHPTKGKLLIPSCKLANEQEGVYNLFKGSIGFFKNPSSHRTVNYEDRLNTIEILALADLLLQILSTAQPRT